MHINGVVLPLFSKTPKEVKGSFEKHTRGGGSKSGVAVTGESKPVPDGHSPCSPPSGSRVHYPVQQPNQVCLC